MNDSDLDTVLDRVQGILDQLGGIVDDLRTDAGLPSDPTATVDLMTPGGWVRMPGSQRWRRIKHVAKCASTIDCWRIDFDTYPRDRDGTFVHVGAGDSFAFLTAEQFDRDCAQEQEDAALSRLAEAAIKSDGQEAA